jgi:hypothetical protein
MKIKGSYAGAFGIGQFLPSSYLRYAVDGNRDGKKDLYHTADALHSVANYLKAHGARMNNEHSQKQAILAYNRDGHYLRSVLSVAKIIKKAMDEEIDEDDILFDRYDYYKYHRRPYSLLNRRGSLIPDIDAYEADINIDEDFDPETSYYTQSYAGEEIDENQIMQVQDILLNPRRTGRARLYKENEDNNGDHLRTDRLGHNSYNRNRYNR